MKTLSKEEFEAQAAIPPTPEELECIRKKKEARRNMTADEIQEGLKQMLDRGIRMKTLSKEEFEAQAAVPATPEELERIRKRKEMRRNMTVDEIQEGLIRTLDRSTSSLTHKLLSDIKSKRKRSSS